MQAADIDWQDNQPYSTRFDDVYYSRRGGRAETEYVFIRQNGLPSRWQGLSHFVIGETGFGTGLNFITTADLWLQTTSTDACLYFVSVEKYPLSRCDLQRALCAWPELAAIARALLALWPPAMAGLHCLDVVPGRVKLLLWLGDVRDMLSQITRPVDAWYLDGFAPARNPDMWSDDVLSGIARNSHAHTTFSTYTSAGEVRRGLQAAGFTVEKVPGFAGKRDMLRGQLNRLAAMADDAPWFCLPQDHARVRKIAIVGAGIAGLTTAASLARRGWQVDLIDAAPDVAQAASGNPAGVLLPRIAAAASPESAFYAAAFFLAQQHLNTLQVGSHEAFWWQSGVIQLLTSERLKKQHASLDLPDTYVRAVTAREASALSGITLTEDALHFPLAGWLSPALLCRRLLQTLPSSVHVLFGRTLAALQRQDSYWRLLDAYQQCIGEYEYVVLANAWQIADYAQTRWLDVQPARGQISLWPATLSSQQLKCPICYDGYVLPAMQGEHVIGASFETGDTATDLRVAEHEQNWQKLSQAVPGLMHGAVSGLYREAGGRAAVRAVTPDRMPLLGPVPDMDWYRENYADLQKGRQPTQYPQARYLPGLFVNAGHGARGLTSAWLAAEILAAQIHQEMLPVTRSVLHALHPARYFIRQSRKNKIAV